MLNIGSPTAILYRNKHIFYFLLFILLLTHSYSIYITTGIFNYTFIDYRVWYSVAKTISNFGFDSIYNIELLKHFQKEVIEYSRYKPITFPSLNDQVLYALPYVYPSIFSIFFVFIGILPIHIDAFMICILFILLSGASLFILQNCFDDYKKLHVTSSDIIASILLSTSSYFSLSFLNPSILLILFCSAGLILHKKDKPVLSGLAYSLCVMKPNIAIWILIGLIFSRQFKATIAMISGVTTLLLSSIAISGIKASTAWINILLNYKSEFGNWAESMPNIRMIYIRCLELTDKNFIAISICLLIIAILVYLIRSIVIKNHRDYSSVMLSFSILSVLLSFHSHVHTASIVLPFGFFHIFQKKKSTVSFYMFLYVPIVVFLLLDALFLDLAIAHLGCAIALVLTCFYFLFSIQHQTYQHS